MLLLCFLFNNDTRWENSAWLHSWSCSLSSSPAYICPYPPLPPLPRWVNSPHRGRLNLISSGLTQSADLSREQVSHPPKCCRLCSAHDTLVTPAIEITFNSISFSISISAYTILLRCTLFPQCVACNPFCKCQTPDKLSDTAAPTPTGWWVIFVMVIILIGFLCPFHFDSEGMENRWGVCMMCVKAYLFWGVCLYVRVCV